MTLEKPTLNDELQYEAVKAKGPVALSRFIEMVSSGESVRMAAMLATQSPPTLGFNDHVIHKNAKHWRDGMTPIVAAEWNRRYREQTGENIPDDAVIMRGLCDRIGDPSVVLTTKHGFKDMVRILEQRGKKVESDDFETKPAQLPPTPQVVRMDEGLVEIYREEYIQEDPDLAHADQRELRERIIDTHTKEVSLSDLNPYGTTSFSDLAGAILQERTRRVAIETSAGDPGGSTGGDAGANT